MRYHCARAALAALFAAGMVLAADPASARSLAEEGAAAPPAEPGPPAGGPEAPAPLADTDGDGLADGLQARLAAMAPDERVDVVVTFSGPGSAASARRAVGAFDVRREFSLISGFAATMTAAQARALARTPGVFRVEEDAEVTTQLDAARPDFGADDVGLLTGGSSPYTGAGVGVCIVDTGVDAGHEQLDANKDDKDKVVAWHDLVNGGTTPYDDNGHGTHVAGIAAGHGRQGDGDSSRAERFRGVARAADIYAVKALDAGGGGTLSRVVAGVEWCADPDQAGAGVGVISMSLGTTGASDGGDSLSQAVDAAAEDAGKIPVVAAGNAGAAPSTVGSPGAAARAITVGAVTDWSALPELGRHDDGVYLRAFSSRGPIEDGNGKVLRVKPDVSAPGSKVASAQYKTTDGYVAFSGTSMATPFVAGVAALMLQADASLGTQAEGEPPPVETVRDLLAATAHERGPAGTDNEFGAGLVDAYAAVAEAAGATSYEPTAFPAYARFEDSVANSGETVITFELTADDLEVPIGATMQIDGSLKCSLRWFGTCLIAEWSPDLELELIDPDGNTLFLSECPARGDCGAVGRWETVHSMPTVAGTYTLRVFPYAGDPNNGKGGSFAVDLSTGPVAGSGGGGGEPPSVDTVSGPSGDEGASVSVSAEFSDPDGGSHTATIDWGDGTQDAGAVTEPADGSPGSVTGSHAYADDGDYTVTVTVTDGAGNSDSGTATASIANVAPQNVGVDAPATVEAGQSLTMTVTFDDPGADDSHTVTVDWGDGNSNSVDGESPVSLSHTYGAAGSYTPAVTVADELDATTVDGPTITVEESSGASSTAHVGDLDGQSTNEGRTWRATITVLVHSGDEQDLANATVAATWDVDGQGVQCTTGGGGTCSVERSFRKNVGSTTLTINSIAHDSLAYESSSNHDPDGDSNGTWIAVSK